MNEEKKDYSIIGKVEIGTDEYRDLIEAVKEAEIKASDYQSRYWTEQNKVSALEHKLNGLESYKEYVVEKCHDSYKLWKMETIEEEDDF